MSRPSLGSSTSSPAHGGLGASRLGRPPTLAPRKSLMALRQAAAAASSGSSPTTASSAAAASFSTPKRASVSHSQAEQQLPDLDIGDGVSIDLPNGTSLTGVLRHLGPVHFKDGVYAGLELTGDSFGKGKNNGEVQGQQYFATHPNNGMFILASKVVKISQGPAADAVARPESALSSSGGHARLARSSSRLSEADRPASRMSLGPASLASTHAFTPARSNMRARSSTTNSYQHSESSSRPSSRASMTHGRGASEAGLPPPPPPAPSALTASAMRTPSSSSTSSGIPAKPRTPSATHTPSGSKLPFSGRKSFGFGAGASRGSTPASAVPPLPRPPSAIAASARAGSRASASRSSSRASSALEEDDLAAEADSERRAKSSAEAAARAAGKISVGSRAHRFIGLRGRDLNAQPGTGNGSPASSSAAAAAMAKEADEVFGSGAPAKPRVSLGSAGPGRASPVKGRPSSPLKATLLGRPSLGGSSNNTLTAAAGGLEALRKARQSLPGNSGLPAPGSVNNTPRPAKGRQSLFSYGGASASAESSAMPPPPSPSKLAGAAARSASAADSHGASPTRSASASGESSVDRPPSSTGLDEGRSKLGGVRATLGGPHTPVKAFAHTTSLASPTAFKSSLRPPVASQVSTSSYGTAIDDTDSAQPGDVPAGDTSLVRRHRLLEEMDLTPKRHSQQGALTDRDHSSRTSSRLSLSETRAAHGEPLSPGPEFVAQASVPLSLYEEAQQEIERLAALVAETERKAAAERASRVEEDRVLRTALDGERARVKEEKEEWEEERRMLRADEERRKREAENRERELKDSLDKIRRELEAASKDLPREIEALKAELGERDKLAQELKRAIEERDQGQAQESGKVQILEAEKKGAEERLRRLESDHKSEVEGLQKEVDDLKSAGTEMLQLFDTRAQELRDELREEIENDYREDMRKTLRDLAAVEAERDALVSKREAEDEARSASGGAGTSGIQAPTAITIENESLREQLAHLQEKVGSLEEELALANVQAETDREAIQAKAQRVAENEANLKAEIKKIKAEADRLAKEERAARQRIEDLNDVVEESKAALETERAEVERLRAEVLSGSGAGMLSAANPSGAGGPPTPTLQDEAMQERAKRAESDKVKLEAEVERLNRLLEGARSGKKEAVRMVEELKKNVEEKIDLIEDVRKELENVENEKTALEARLTQSSRGEAPMEGSAVLVRSLRRTIEDKNKEVEMLKRTHMPLPDQLLELRKIHSDEMALKDEELRKMRTSLAAAKASAKKVSDGSASSGAGAGERRALSPIVGQQVSSGSVESSLTASVGGGKERPLSFSSITSKGSRGETVSTDHSRSENHMVANQMSGLNYLVRQLTDENAKVKSQYRLLEQQSKEMVQEAQSEARVSNLTLDSLRSDIAALQAGGSSSIDLVQLRTEFSQRTATLEKQVRDSQAEIDKLKAEAKSFSAQQKRTLEAQAKEISDLELLIESQIYKLDEKEEMHERLQRKLDRANAYIDELRTQLEKGSSPSKAVKTPVRRHSEDDSVGTARDAEEEGDDSPSQTQALRWRKTSENAGGGNSTTDSMATVGPHQRSVYGGSSTTSDHAALADSTVTQALGLGSAGKTSFVPSSKDDLTEDEDDDDEEDLENFCVLCNQSGHSVVNCTNHLVTPGLGTHSAGGSGGGRSPAIGADAGKTGGGQFDEDDEPCDDCGEKGHKLEDCPYADVF
ncbi:hypothetical protein V8E36_005624 [Tilletia maclaganii]